MLYTLLKDDRIVTGPRDWNPKYFEYFLSQECDVETSLSEYPIVESLAFNDSVKLVPTHQLELPTIDLLYETIAGPNFKYDEEGRFISYYVAQEYSIDIVKKNLLQAISDVRWKKETSPITREIGGSLLTIYTDRESRNSYTQALLSATDEYSATWKFPQGFVTLNKSDLQNILNNVTTYVQECFDWEATKANEINSKNDVEELKQIILE